MIHEKEKPENLWFNLGVIVFLITLIGVGAAYYIDSLGNSQKEEIEFAKNEQKILRIIANQTLEIPSSWFRYNTFEKQEFVESIELTFLLPILENNQNANIDVIIEPLRKVQTSARLLDNVYLLQFLRAEKKDIKGLIGKPLKNILGNIDERVFYDPISAKPFVTKCMRSPITTTQKCIRSVQISENLAATYSFDFAALAGWRQFDEQAQKWFDKIDGL